MADVQVTISVQPEIQAILDPLVKLAQDLKAKAPAASLMGDGAPILLALMTGYAALSADLKSAEAQAYLGYSLGRIIGVFTASAP